MSAPRRFLLIRDRDQSGVSGTGHVASGVEFEGGQVVLCWRTRPSSVAVYANIRDCAAIHGHGGQTRLHWVDDPPAPAQGAPPVDLGALDEVPAQGSWR